jgi:hypothetical protein
MMDESELETIQNAVNVELPKADVPSVQDAIVVPPTQETFEAFNKEMNEALGLDHLKDIFKAVNIAGKNNQITKEQWDKLTSLKDTLKKQLK